MTTQQGKTYQFKLVLLGKFDRVHDAEEAYTKCQLFY